jgi:hydroxymethylglutaryl-CoA reductase (NADPH)
MTILKHLFKPFAIHAAHSPIETIVFFSVIGTLAYFHVLFAVKHSAFFAPSLPSTLRPTHALLRDNEWVVVRENTWYDARVGMDNSVTPLEVQQIIFSLDSPARKSKEASTAYHLFIVGPNILYLDVKRFADP